MTNAAPPDTGNVFVANYPPFPSWSERDVPAALAAIDAPPRPGVPLGAYVHVPFCRQRCRFCYYKVYTEAPGSEVRDYVEGVLAEARLYADRAVVGGRALSYLYVGGGTPSYLSSEQIRVLLGGLRATLPWAPGAELTFECEPGTVRAPKVEALVEAGVTRVSLGVESWDEGVLSLNGRAHEAKHIEPAFRLCRVAGVPQINLDLLAGLIGETDASWAMAVERTLALRPDSVTIYQLEIPANTAIYRALQGLEDLGGPVADVPTRRRWATEAFERLQAAGYTMTSGYTAVLGDPTGKFVYRDALWRGADMIPLGVSSFGTLSGVHVQNDKHREGWRAAVAEGRLPLQRACATTADERLVRELVLRLKLGRVDPRELSQKHGVDVLTRFAAQLASLVDEGLATVAPDAITLSWPALMQVDRLLPRFFHDAHRDPAPVRSASGGTLHA